MRIQNLERVNRMLIGISIGVAVLLGASSSKALSISAEFNLEYSMIANPVFLASPGDLRVNLTTGDLIALEVFVSNPSADLITAIFATLVYDYFQLSFLGGVFYDILTEASCAEPMCTPATLSPLGIPSDKPGSPPSLATGTTGWLQAVSHVNITGAAGAGPDAAVLLAFQYNGLGGYETVLITAAETAGDASAGNVGPIIFSGATINLPEPGTALLFGLGLIGLGSTRRDGSRASHEQY